MTRARLLISWLLLACSPLAWAGEGGAAGGSLIIRHPYAEVDWNVIKQYNFAHHVHARGLHY